MAEKLLPFEVLYEFDFDDEGETIITSPFCPNSFFHGEDEEGTLTPVFSPDHYPFPSTGSDHVSLETLHHLDLGLGLGLGLGQEPSLAAPHADSGLRVAGFGFGSESDPDAEYDPIPNPGELCWDDDDFFEWEEIEARPITRTVEWETRSGTPMALLMEELDDGDGEVESLQDFDMNPSRYDILFGHFADNDSPLWVGGPPASKAAMESIPSVSVEAGGNACAVCKEEMEGTVRQLPCSHPYHGDCIMPWLAIRNTCPVCRFELPTDCPCYESGRRGGIRYDSEMFPQM